MPGKLLNLQNLRLSALCLALCALAPFTGASADPLPQAPWRQIADMDRATNYADAVQYYKGLPAADQTAQAAYYTAHAYMRLHRPLEAEVLLKQAKALSFVPPPAWPSIDSMLDRIAIFRQTMPPFTMQIGTAPATMRIYAQPGEFANKLIALVPSYIERMKQIFGERIKPVDFVIFNSRADYDRFFTALTTHHAESRQHGTGIINMLILCKQDADGTDDSYFQKQPDFLAGVALHEYGHAMFRTIYGEQFTKVVPTWMDEGLADAIARPYYRNLYTDAKRRVAQAPSLPLYSALKDYVYSNPKDGYALSRLTVDQILGIDPDANIFSLVDKAFLLRDANAAALKVSGTSLEQAYQQVVMNAHRQ